MKKPNYLICKKCKRKAYKFEECGNYMGLGGEVFFSALCQSASCGSIYFKPWATEKSNAEAYFKGPI